MSAQYTVVLRDLLKNPEVRAKINEELKTYPMYETKSENPIIRSLIPTREQLNEKLLNAYKYREIGFETVGRFIDELGIAMREIMPLYNQRFKTVEIMNEIPNPFDNVDIVETYSETREDQAQSQGNVQSQSETNSSDETANQTNASASSSNNSTNKDNSKAVKSETPQGVLNIGTKNIDSVNYADEANWSESEATANANTSEQSEASSNSNSSANTESSGTTTSENTSNATGKTEHTFTKKGNQGVNTYAHDINEYRTTLLNIEQEIINDRRIKQLFMMIY